MDTLHLGFSCLVFKDAGSQSAPCFQGCFIADTEPTKSALLSLLVL